MPLERRAFDKAGEKAAFQQLWLDPLKVSLMDWKVREYQCFALSVHLLKISGRRASGETARERRGGTRTCINCVI